MIGFQISNWKALVSFVKEAACIVKNANLIAWDIAILEDGFEMVEGNYDGDSGFMQSPSQEGKKKKIVNVINQIKKK